MEGLSERAYAAHSGLSRGAIQKARKAGRLVVYGDGSINAAASDARRAEMTDPDQQRRSTGGETAFSGPADSASYLKARTALTVYQAQERQLAIQKKKGTLVDRARARNAGVPTGTPGTGRLGHLAQQGRGADGSGPDSGGGKATRRDSYDRGRDPAEGAGNPCQSATRRPCRSPGQPRTVTARPMMI